MHFNIIVCFWAHLDSCSLLWTHFRGAAGALSKYISFRIFKEFPFLFIHSGLLYIHVATCTKVAQRGRNKNFPSSSSSRNQLVTPIYFLYL